MTRRAELTALAGRVMGLDRPNNSVDVLVEVAMFKPGVCHTACKPNIAGTKVILTSHTGNEITSWADDWTTAARRKETAAALLALAEAEQ
jgi:hypothetical protein